MKIARGCAVLVFVVAFCTALTFADTPGHHPGYLHALSNLRHARAHLAQLTPSEHMDAEQQHAIDEIDKAIGEIKAASIDDGKNLDDHPPVAPSMDRKGRYRRAVELLQKADNDLSQQEDNPTVRAFRDRAMHHTEEAQHIVDHLIHQAGY